MVLVLSASFLVATIFFNVEIGYLESLFVGIAASFLASIAIIAPLEKDRYNREQHRLLAIWEESGYLSQRLAKIIGYDVVLDLKLPDDQLRKLYLNDSQRKDIRAFIPNVIRRLEEIIASSPELEITYWNGLYIVKRELATQYEFSHGSNDLICLTKALRVMHTVGEKSICVPEKNHSMKKD